MPSDDVFAAEINGLAELFGRSLSDAVVDLYFRALARLTDDELRYACGRAAEECQHFPRPAELLRIVRGSPEDRALEAWESVVRAIARHGRWASVDFEDKAINATIRSLGGWIELCGKEGDAFDVWARKEFLRIYPAYAERGVDNSFGWHLPGIAEQGNVAGGQEVEPPTRIGLPRRPLAIGEGTPR